MAEPTKKAKAVEEFLSKTFGFDRRETIRKDVCIDPPMGCGKTATFASDIERREFCISGRCGPCQRKVFKSMDMDDNPI